MKKIWMESPYSWSPASKWQWVLHFLVIGVLIGSFSFFSLYAKLTGRLFSANKIDIFHDLDQIAFYFWVLDPELSEKIRSFDHILQAYLEGENVLQTKEDQLFDLRAYAKDRKSYLMRVGFSQYERIFQMLEDAWPMRSEIFALLGRDQRFNYLIPLQNSNEARPNGGFFGSFAFVGLSGGHIADLQVVDSYLPDYIAPDTRVELPEWMGKVLGGRHVGFIAGNKFGFTDKDGKNLKNLYEKIFHTDFDPERKARLFAPEKRNQLFAQNIKGVIFLDSELISYLLPSFTEKAREWQFVNANIDLIRGESRSNKKELYIQDLNSYLKDHMFALASSSLNSVQDLLHKGFVNIYLSNVSPQMRGWLQAYDLTTVYDPRFLYFWNINTAYNKSDAFLHKRVELLSPDGEVLLALDGKKLNISALQPWNYRLMISYTFDVPKSYQDQMARLEEKYGIQMSDRERYILALQDYSADPTAPKMRRQTKELMYFPFGWEILDVRGEQEKNLIFETDFAQGLMYQTTIRDNQQTNRVEIDIRVP